MKYRTRKLFRLVDGHRIPGVELVASNGQGIAQCKTKKMADKIKAALTLYDEAQKKKADFKV